MLSVYLTHYLRQILDSSKLKEFADHNFKFDKNDRKLSKRKKTLGKGEIAHYEQFLLFPQCFQKACFPWASKGVIVWEWVKSINTHISVVICIFFEFGIVSKWCIREWVNTIFYLNS